MKNKLINSRLRKLTKGLIFLCFLLLTFVISCRKERHQVNFEKKILSQNSSDFLSRINAIKIKYYDLNLNEKLNKNTSQNFKWAPNWDNPIVQTVNDTVSYVFFPMQAQKLVDGRLITAKELDSKTYLIVKNEKEYFKGIFYQPSSIGEPKTLSLLHFSGRLLLSNLATKEGFIIDYNNGEPLKTNLSNTVKLNKTSNIGGLSSTTITNCTTIEYCSFMSDGPCRDGSWYLLYRLDCNSIYNSRYSCSNWNLIDYFSETTCETIHTFEDPPMPPEEGGGSNSSGDDTSPTTEQSKNPCDEVKIINQKAQNQQLKDATTALSKKPNDKEYGMTQKLVSLKGQTYKELKINPSGINSYTMDFTWNETDGYAIGFSHKHTVGTGPSPGDVMGPFFFAYEPELTKSGQQQFFKDNLTVTTLSDGNIYVLTIADWGALENINKSNSLDGLNEQYQKFAEKFYYGNNETTSAMQNSEYALMKLFGSAINLYKKEVGATNFTPYKIDINDNVIKNPCK